MSVVIPTYRRPEALGRCLDALARQIRVADEVLVVARQDDEASRLFMRERKDDSVRLVPLDVPEGRPGFVAALNAGVDASTGEIVCLTDDDAEPHPDWLARILETFEQDPQIGAVGGRDWVFHGDQLEDGAESTVGTVSRWGKFVGRHHLGIGPARDVSALKGVNLSVRGDLIRQVGFDRRLRGSTTEHHSELGLCFALLRKGYRVVYDPAIAVDHRPQPRVREERERGGRDVRDAAHNETLALLEHLPLLARMTHLAWATAVGSRVLPGFASAVRLKLASKKGSLSLLRGNLSGRIRAVGTYLRSRDSAGSSHDREAPAPADLRVLGLGQTPAAAARAAHLLAGIPGAEVASAEPGIEGMLRATWLVVRSRASVLYLVDVGKATTSAAVIGRLTRRRVIVDTGDASYALARSLGDRSFIGLALVGAGEQFALRSAHEVVVRGRAHASHVPRPATHIPDLPPVGAQPVPAAELRQALDLDGAFVVGLVGSLILSERHRISYGWDLIEALPDTDPSVHALIVGDGSGLESLRQRASTLGVIDRCRFTGRVPVDQVFGLVSVMNVAISTQTNDIVGQVRTTGKLPLYLACGCPVLASHVGEAAVLLAPHGWTLSYSGVVDRSYPSRLAMAIETWRLKPEEGSARSRLALEIAARDFDSRTMQARLENVISRARA